LDDLNFHGSLLLKTVQCAVDPYLAAGGGSSTYHGQTLFEDDFRVPF
jgi:hypothetical protein